MRVRGKNGGVRGFGLVCLLLCACHTPEWSNLRVASPYRRPTYGVNVSFTMGVAGGSGLEAYVEALTAELVDALKDVGLDATVDMESPESAQLRLHIADWDPGDEAARILVGHGLGEGHIVIVVDMKEPSGKTLIHGLVKGHFAGGIYGGSRDDARHAEAKSIAKVVSTGE